MSTPVPERPSVQSRALASLMMSSVRPLGDVLRRPIGSHLRLARQACDRLGMFQLPSRTRVRPLSAHGLRGQWVIARNARSSQGAMLYLHGGGFVFGSPVFYRRLAAQLSAASGMPVLVLDYRLAPEHPFPAAADDAIAAYRWLLGDGYRPERLVIAGDSAGGHLVAGLLADIARGKLPMPAAAAMLSPFLDLTGEQLDERDRARRDPFVPPDYARACAKAYAGAGGISQKRLNVLKVRKRGWPPILIQVGDTECLLGDSQRMADSLCAAGVPCELQVWPGQVHVFHWFTPFVPEATAAIRYAGEFLRSAGEQRAAA